MKIKIVYDNEAEGALESDWGFSALVSKKENILFDTGTKPRILAENLDKLNIDRGIIDKIVLSHEHDDHIGGLEAVLREDTEVFVPKSFSKRYRRNLKKICKVIEVLKPTEISPGMMSTGVLKGRKDEQSLIVEVRDGVVLVTGCAHPGLDNIICKAKEFGEIKAVLGGFHSFTKFKELAGINFVLPCHCTKYKQKIKELYPKKYIECYAGQEFSMGD